MPSATPDALAAAIVECIAAGARVINLSLALAQPSVKGEHALEQALNQAARRARLWSLRRGIKAPLEAPPLPAIRGSSR